MKPKTEFKNRWRLSFKRHLAAWTGVLLLLTLPAMLQAQFTYVTNNGTVTITGYTGPGGAVIIPSTINGLPVTSIGDYAFQGRSSVTSVTITNNVTSIGTGAFSFCSSLASVTIGNSVTNIGTSTFIWCTNLASVTIPNSVTSIGDSAFAVCVKLASVTIPNSVTNIGPDAFGSCMSLTSVMIPNSVTSIGFGAFSDCSKLTAITVEALNSAYSSVDGVLFNQNQTTLVEYPGGKGPYTIPNSVTSIGEAAFRYCTNLTSVTIPTSVTSIGEAAFVYCRNLTSVTIPNSVTNIGDSAFGSCSRLASVTIPNSITGIPFDGFSGCNLTSVTIPNSVTSIGVYAFIGCPNLTNVTIPSSVTSIGDSAFERCVSLSSVTIPNSVTNIGAEAFESTSLTSVTIPNSVTIIRVGAFESCSSLASVTIPNSVTSIENYAFNGCWMNLTNITIPNSVTNIGERAFGQCYNLAGVYFQGNAPNVGSDVFKYDYNAPTVYYVPGTTGWGATFGGRPTAVWVQVPTLQTSPRTQTAEAGSAVSLWAHASSPLPLYYLWYLNSTNFISSSTNNGLELSNVQFAQSGAYTVVISNALGKVTSAPAMLNVIAAVERRPVPSVKVTGETGSLLNLDYASVLSPMPDWTTLGSVSLTSTSQFYLDLSTPLPPQRFYRAWQTGTPSVVPSLDLNFVPAITLTGNVGDSLRLDYIDAIGPTDAWVTLATVTLTNTSQLYFDVSAPGQPARLYRVIPVP